MSETITMTFLKLCKIIHARIVKGVEIQIQSSLFFRIHHPDTRSLFIAIRTMF